MTLLSSVTKLFNPKANEPKPSGGKTRSRVESLPVWELMGNEKGGIVVNRNRVIEIGIELALPSTMFYSPEGLDKLNQSIRLIIRNTLPESERARMILEVLPSQNKALIDTYRQSITTTQPIIREVANTRADLLEYMMRKGAVQDWKMYLTVTLSHWKTKGFELQSFSEREWETIERTADFLRDRLLKDLTNAQITARAMNRDDLFNLMWRYTNLSLTKCDPPKFIPMEQRQLPYIGKNYIAAQPQLTMETLRDQLVCVEANNEDHHILQIDDVYVGTLEMTKLPDFTAFGIINKSLPADGNFYMFIDFQHPKQAIEQRRLMDKTRQNSGLAQGDGVTAFVDPGLTNKLGEQIGALSHMAQTGAHLVNCAITLIYFADSRDSLRERTNRIYSAFSGLPGIKVEKGMFNNHKLYTDCFPMAGLMPTHVKATLDNTVSNLIPVTAPWIGSQKPTVIFGNSWSAFTGIDVFDQRATNNNGLVIGGSGSGKSVLIGTMIGEVLKSDGEVYVIDRGFSHANMIKLAGGAVIPIEVGKVSINCFDIPPYIQELYADNKTEFEQEIQVKIAFIVNLVQEMAPTDDEEKSSIEEAILSSTIRKVYEMAFSVEYREDTNQTLVTFKVPRLSDLATALTRITEVADKPVTDDDKIVAQRLATRLGNWVGKQPLAAFVDRETNVNIEGSVYFETTGLRNHPSLKVVGMMLVADLIWRKVQSTKGKRKLMVYDEWGTMLENPRGVAVAVEMFRTARKFGCAVYAVSQSLHDFMHPSTQGILQSVNYYFLFSLPGEDELIAEKLELKPWAMNNFKQLRQVRGQYSEAMAWVKHGFGSEGGVIRVQPSPMEYWIMTTAPADKDKRDKAIAHFNGDLFKAIKACADGTF